MWKKAWQKMDLYAVLTIFAVIALVNLPYLKFSTFSNSDEFTSLAVPALLSGKDWSNVASLSGFHGFGLTILLTPLFYLSQDPIFVYRGALLVALIVKMATGFIAYLIMRRELEIRVSISLFFTLIYVCGTFAPDDSCGLSVMSEIPLGFLCVLLIWLFLRYMDTTQKRYVVLSGVVLAYAYTIHSRCIVLWAATAAALTVYAFLYCRKKADVLHAIRHGVLPLITTGVFFLIPLVMGSNWINGKLYQIAEGEQLANDTSTVLKSSSYLLLKIFDPEKLSVVILTFFSLYGTLVLLSAGMICFFSACCIKECCFKENKKATFIALFSILALTMMNFSEALTSTGHIERGTYSWLTYIRYCKPFLGGFIFIGAYYLDTPRRITRSVRYLTVFITVSAILFVINWLSPVLSEKYGLNYTILNRIFYDSSKMTVSDFFAVFSVITLDFMLFFLVLFNQRREKFFLTVYLVFHLVVQGQQTQFYIEANQRAIQKTDAVMKLYDSGFFKDYEFVADADSVVAALYLQYAIFEEPLQAMRPEEIEDWSRIILFSDKEDIECKETLKQIKLDENEYLYTTDSKIQKEFDDL